MHVCCPEWLSQMNPKDVQAAQSLLRQLVQCSKFPQQVAVGNQASVLAAAPVTSSKGSMGKNGTSNFIGCMGWAWHGESRPRFVTPDDPRKRRKQGDCGLRLRQKAALGKLCF